MLPEYLFLPVFALLGQPVTPLELVAFVSGAACVWLAVKMHIANWPVGLLSVACYALLFWHVRLYADSLLQVVFFVVGVYGWWCWRQAPAGRAESPSFAVSLASGRQWGAVLGMACAGTLAVAAYLRAFTDSPLPFLDASILCLSLAALWWQAGKVLESWWLWILVDLISIPVYWSRDLALTSVLYGIFLVMCVFGLREWRARLPTVVRSGVPDA